MNQDIIDEIKRLKTERNAVILAHYYQQGEIQDLADHIGDSLALARIAATLDNPVSVLCGVHFMGETAKILCPDKVVLVPDVVAAARWPTRAPPMLSKHSSRSIPGTR